MRQYEYKILKFLPDESTGEFLNIGIIIYFPDEQVFSWYFIESTKRIANTFPGLRVSNYSAYINSLICCLMTKNISKFKSLKEFCSSIFYDDNTALRWSETMRGIDKNSEKALNSLKKQYLKYYEEVS